MKEICSNCIFFSLYLKGELKGWGECTNEEVYPNIRVPKTPESLKCIKFIKKL